MTTDTATQHRTRPRGMLAWLLVTGVAMTAAQFAKFPAMQRFVTAELEQGPATDGASTATIGAALDIGVVLGLLLGTVLGWIVLAVVWRQGPRFTTCTERFTVFPCWLTGIASVGLVVPDLFTAVTGEIFLVQSWMFLLAYALLIAIAIAFAPGPRFRRLRVADGVLAILLLFI